MSEGRETIFHNSLKFRSLRRERSFPRLKTQKGTETFHQLPLVEGIPKSIMPIRSMLTIERILTGQHRNGTQILSKAPRKG